MTRDFKVSRGSVVSGYRGQEISKFQEALWFQGIEDKRFQSFKRLCGFRV